MSSTQTELMEVTAALNDWRANKKKSHERVPAELLSRARSLRGGDLSTPETGIWSKDDIDPATLEIRPTKFSGPYAIKKWDASGISLKRNKYNPVFSDFPNAPENIESIGGAYSQVEEKLSHGDVDVLIRNEKPMGEPNWEARGLSVVRSADQSVIYLHSLNASGDRPLLGKNFVQAVWRAADRAHMTPATSILPFKSAYTLDEAVTLKNLSDGSAPEVRVAIPDNGFYNQEFLKLLGDAAHSVGVHLVFKSLSFDKYLRLFYVHPDSKDFDYVLTVYSANERFLSRPSDLTTPPSHAPTTVVFQCTLDATRVFTPPPRS